MTAVATGWQGPGAPEQLISGGAHYHDTVEGRDYIQQTNMWVLVPLTTH